MIGTGELNFRVRDGNGWDLTVIDTGRVYQRTGLPALDILLWNAKVLALGAPAKPSDFVGQRSGDPWGNRTPVTGVRGRCLNRLTNGP